MAVYKIKYDSKGKVKTIKKDVKKTASFNKAIAKRKSSSSSKSSSSNSSAVQIDATVNRNTGDITTVKTLGGVTTTSFYNATSKKTKTINGRASPTQLKNLQNATAPIITTPSILDKRKALLKEQEEKGLQPQIIRLSDGRVIQKGRFESNIDFERRKRDFEKQYGDLIIKPTNKGILDFRPKTPINYFEKKDTFSVSPLNEEIQQTTTRDFTPQAIQRQKAIFSLTNLGKISRGFAGEKLIETSLGLMVLNTKTGKLRQLTKEERKEVTKSSNINLNPINIVTGFLGTAKDIAMFIKSPNKIQTSSKIVSSIVTNPTGTIESLITHAITNPFSFYGETLAFNGLGKIVKITGKSSLSFIKKLKIINTSRLKIIETSIKKLKDEGVNTRTRNNPKSTELRLLLEEQRIIKLDLNDLSKTLELIKKPIKTKPQLTKVVNEVKTIQTKFRSRKPQRVKIVNNNKAIGSLFKKLETKPTLKPKTNLSPKIVNKITKSIKDLDNTISRLKELKSNPTTKSKTKLRIEKELISLDNFKKNIIKSKQIFIETISKQPTLKGKTRVINQINSQIQKMSSIIEYSSELNKLMKKIKSVEPNTRKLFQMESFKIKAIYGGSVDKVVKLLKHPDIMSMPKATLNQLINKMKKLNKKGALVKTKEVIKPAVKKLKIIIEKNRLTKTQLDDILKKTTTKESINYQRNLLNKKINNIKTQLSIMKSTIKDTKTIKTLTNQAKVEIIKLENTIKNLLKPKLKISQTQTLSRATQFEKQIQKTKIKVSSHVLDKSIKYDYKIGDVTFQFEFKKPPKNIQAYYSGLKIPQMKLRIKTRTSSYKLETPKPIIDKFYKEIKRAYKNDRNINRIKVLDKNIIKANIKIKKLIKEQIKIKGKTKTKLQNQLQNQLKLNTQIINKVTNLLQLSSKLILISVLSNKTQNVSSLQNQLQLQLKQVQDLQNKQQNQLQNITKQKPFKQPKNIKKDKDKPSPFRRPRVTSSRLTKPIPKPIIKANIKTTNAIKPPIKKRLPSSTKKIITTKGKLGIITYKIGRKTKTIKTNLPFNKALKLARETIDNTILASMTIKAYGNTRKSDIIKPNLRKFTLRIGKNPLVQELVEKRKFRLDTIGEKTDIKIRKFIKNKMRRLL